jgi:hypothetical protein
MATDEATGDEARLQISLTKAQALAAGAVLRGYLAHQRERLGDGAAANPNFRNVQDALNAIEARTGGAVR